MRGQLTDKIQEIARRKMGREITTIELRLMPYVQYVMMNEQKLDIQKISTEERKILRQWKEEKYIEGGAGSLAITREFWDILNEILWEGYVVGTAAGYVDGITYSDAAPKEAR